MQTIGEEGIALIKFFEGCKLNPYTCPGGVLTIGYGETGKHVRPDMRLANEQEADARLRARLAKEFEPAVRRYVRVPLKQHQFDALVSLSFNIGTGAFHRSTLLRKLNAGDVAGAAEQFGAWKFSSGRVLPGLVRRRKAERWLFEGQDWQAALAAEHAAVKKASRD
ncbi:lysozyme [Xylella fastidiosa]|uniref:lysozyme n=1 Tax=Xylella fastidiosa TaxID=2371 RepID=UPI0003D2DE3D|nr:lysozyme [Xylella fastidiosa]ALR01593.1 peptidase [Xylella fastidiosa]ALR03836.1 lysozyme [Xylella fastidiosa]ARO68712.1 peptidase [Xylella fastidiosa subsp. pauca]ARO68813.1 peptidase [Xylella fastidiosa subsp. pauca]AVI20795.1 peptidase [Xylella fastidiosa]